MENNLEYLAHLQMKKVVEHNEQLIKENEELKKQAQPVNIDKEVELQMKITGLVLTDPESHIGLIEEALEFFLLDGIGDADKLQEIYDDTKNRIKVY
jgi:hypothetical protein